MVRSDRRHWESAGAAKGEGSYKRRRRDRVGGVGDREKLAREAAHVLSEDLPMDQTFFRCSKGCEVA